MIKFFRKIRQNMLTENKFSKYLLYAIGEVILVVIGILIALQINIANNYKEQRELEQKYLLSLQSEFENNLSKLNKEIQENQERVDAVNDLMVLFDKKNTDTVSNEVVSKLFSTVLGTTLTYEPSTGVLKDIISSGNLNLLQNQELRENLATFEGSMEFYKRQENDAHSVKSDLQRLFYQKGSVRNIMKASGRNINYNSISDTVNNKVLFNSLEFENYLLDYFMTIRGANTDRYLGGLRKEIEEILKEISKDSNK